jgi:hypothetical protein
MAGFGQNFLNYFVPSYETDEEEQAADLQDQSVDAWGNVLSGAPTQNDLLGLSGFAGQAPQEYIDEYLAENSSGPATGGLREGNDRRADRQQGNLTQQAQEQWLQEQMASDPYFGLQQLGTSELSGAGADPASIQAQRDALRQMQGIYEDGGYTDSERAQLQMSQRDAAMGERSQRMAVQQQAAARGMGGGGMELMGALAAQQGGANRANDSANQIAIAGQQRALQALQNSGQVASQMRGQSFGEDASRRQAADAWTAANVGAQNAWTQNRGDAAQQTFNNTVTGTQGLTGQQNTAANYYQNVANQNTAGAGATTQAIAGAAMQGFGAMGGGPTGTMGGTGTGSGGGISSILGVGRGTETEDPYAIYRNGGR